MHELRFSIAKEVVFGTKILSLSRSFRNSLKECVCFKFSGRLFQSFDVLGMKESRYKFVPDLEMWIFL